MILRLYCKETGIGTGDLVRHRWKGWRGIVRNILKINCSERYDTELIDSRWRTEICFPQAVIVAEVDRIMCGFTRIESVPTMELESIGDESNG